MFAAQQGPALLSAAGAGICVSGMRCAALRREGWRTAAVRDWVRALWPASAAVAVLSLFWPERTAAVAGVLLSAGYAVWAVQRYFRRPRAETAAMPPPPQQYKVSTFLTERNKPERPAPAAVRAPDPPEQQYRPNVTLAEAIREGLVAGLDYRQLQNKTRSKGFPVAAGRSVKEKTYRRAEIVAWERARLGLEPESSNVIRIDRSRKDTA